MRRSRVGLLSWIVAIAFILATALLFVDRLNVVATPPELPSANLVDRVLGSATYRQAIWPVFFWTNLLFAIGFAGVILRRNIIIIFMCLELMLNAANLSLVAFSRFNVGANGLPNYNAQVLVFFIITVAAAEVAVGLAIIVALFRARQTVHVEDINSMKF